MPSSELYAHGTVTSPPSRVYNCYQEGPEGPLSGGCIAAIAESGSAPFYDWMSVLQANAGGDHEGVVNNGNLASGGDPDKFGGLDLALSDWFKTDVSAGAFDVVWTNTAPHATQYYQVYITTADWTPSMPLTWDKLELLITTDPSPAEATSVISVTLPARTGPHVIYSIWQRSDSPEAFYSASDVMFDETEPPPPPVFTDTSRVVANSLKVDSFLTVGTGQRITGDNSDIYFNDGEADQFKLGYSSTNNKFTIEDIGQGIALEIRDGSIYLPQYTNGQVRSLGVNGEGKLIELESLGSTGIQKFNNYDFGVFEENAGFTTTRKGLRFSDNVVLTGVNAYLHDGNALTGSDNNSVSVTVYRRFKINGSFAPEVVYVLTANNTGVQTYNSFTQTTPQFPGQQREVIDNDTYIYYVEIKYCNACDFREVTILE